MPSYPLQWQRCILVACHVIYDFIRTGGIRERLFEVECLELFDGEGPRRSQQSSEEDMSQVIVNQMSENCGDIIGRMWLDFVNNNTCIFFFLFPFLFGFLAFIFLDRLWFLILHSGKLLSVLSTVIRFIVGLITEIACYL